MKRLYLLTISVLLLVSCKTGSYYVGTTGSKFSTDSFLSKEEWVKSVKLINKNSKLRGNNSILWPVVISQDSSVTLSFPGKSNSEGIEFSGVDFNRDYFSYFKKEGVSVYLLIEPGSEDVQSLILAVLEQYSSNSSVKGVCVDMDWFNGEKIDLGSWYSTIKGFNKEYLLLLKSWSVDSVPSYLDESVVYINSLRGISSRDDLIKRIHLWYKEYYPSKIGFEIGFSEDISLWSNYSVTSFLNDLKEGDIDYSFIFWSEDNLKAFQK